MNKTSDLTPQAYADIAAGLLDELSSVVLGKRRETVLLFCALIVGGHVMIEDIPGVGKTTLADALSRASGLSYNRVQCTPDVTASDITGYNIFNQKSGEFEFRSGVVMCNMLLADEINRASPKTQSSLLEAMNDGKVTVDGKCYALPDPFMVIATQNPLGFVGTYPLPEAQLDRFALRISLGYPQKEDELSIIRGRSHEKTLSSVRRCADAAVIGNMKKLVETVKCADSIYEYIVDFATATRNSPLLSLGASPRASIMLVKLAKALAFTEKRDYVIPSDVTSLLVPALAHRVLLSRAALSEGITANEAIKRIASTVPIPVLSDGTAKSK